MKTKLTVIAVFFLVTSFQFSAVAAEGEPLVPMTEMELKTAILDLEARTEQLQEAKKNADTRAERKQIRAEIRGIKKEARQLKQQAGSGIYIGGGALLVAVVLLVLLL